MAQKKPSPLLRAVGARLRTARKRAGVTAAKLAADGGIDAPRLSRFESGSRGLDTEPLLGLLGAAHLAGISVEFVLFGIGNELRGVAILAEDADTVQALIEIAHRLERRTVESNRPNQLPRASGQRK